MDVTGVLVWLVVALLGLCAALLGALLKLHKDADDARIRNLECTVKELRETIVDLRVHRR